MGRKKWKKSKKDKSPGRSDGSRDNSPSRGSDSDHGDSPVQESPPAPQEAPQQDQGQEDGGVTKPPSDVPMFSPLPLLGPGQPPTGQASGPPAAVAPSGYDPQHQLLQQLLFHQQLLQQQLLQQQEQLQRQWREQREWQVEQEKLHAERLLRLQKREEYLDPRATREAEAGEASNQGTLTRREDGENEPKTDVAQGTREKEQDEGQDVRKARRQSEDAAGASPPVVDQVESEKALQEQGPRTQGKEVSQGEEGETKQPGSEQKSQERDTEVRREVEEKRDPEKTLTEKREKETTKAEEEGRMLTRLKFTVAYSSSFEEPYLPAHLTPIGCKTNGKGWRSAPSCSYPQEIGLALAGFSQLKFLQLLSHESLIARKVEIWVAAPPSLPPFWSSNSLSPPPPSPALTEAYRRASFTRLGYLRLSSNEASKHRARELKSVNFPEFIDTLFIKLLLLSPHSLPELNPHQQVSLIALNCLGLPYPSRPPLPPHLPTLPDLNREEEELLQEEFLKQQGIPASRGTPTYLNNFQALMTRHAGQQCGPGAVRSRATNRNTYTHGCPGASSPHRHHQRHSHHEDTGKGHAFGRRVPLSAYLKEQGDLLVKAKQRFVQEENFAAAALALKAMERLREMKPQVDELEAFEQEAVRREDFEKAAMLKKQLLSWQLCIKKTVAAALCLSTDQMRQDEKREEQALLRDRQLLAHLDQKLPQSTPSSLVAPKFMDMLQNTQPLPCPCESPEPLGTSPVNDESLKQEPEKPEEPSAPVFIAPDDLPIRPMKLEQQRQLMMLRDSDENIKTMLRVTPVKMPVAPDAPGGATSPGKEEELRPEDAEEAAPLMPFFPPEIIAALFSSQVQARSSALEGIVAELKEHADEITGNLFLALCVVMRRAFKDKILKVFLGGAQLLALFLDAPALQPRHFLSPQFRPVLHELCLRVGDVISDRACRLLLQLCSARPELKDEFAREIFDRLVLASKSVAGGVNSKAGGGGGSPLIGAGRGIGGSGAGEKNFKTRAGSGGGPYLETKLSNSGRALGVPGKGSGDGGVVANGGGLGGAAAHQHKTTAQLLHLLASLLAAHSIIQPLSPQGLPLMPLLNVLGGCFQSPSGDTRAAAVRVTALLLMQVPHPATQAKVNQFVETLRPKQKEMVMADLERLRQLGNEPPGDFSGGSGPIQFRAGGPHFPVSTPPPRSTRGSTPVSTGGGTGGGKNAKKAVQGRNKPQEGRRSDVPSRTGVDSETAKKDENESLGPACEFCLKRSPEFASRSAGGGLERHLLLKCPMLAPCPYCRNIIEVSNLPNHVLAECSETKAYVRCDNCRIVLLATQLPSHKQYACKAPPDPDSQHCYFCRELIPPSVTAWREHLLFDCPANPRRPPHGT